MPDSLLEQRREFLKDTIRQKINFSQTDQSRKIAPPPLEKPFSADATRIRLVAPDQWQGIGQMDLASAIRNRQSRREFTDKPLTLAELRERS